MGHSRTLIETPRTRGGVGEGGERKEQDGGFWEHDESDRFREDDGGDWLQEGTGPEDRRWRINVKECLHCGNMELDRGLHIPPDTASDVPCQWLSPSSPSDTGSIAIRLLSNRIR